VLALEIEIFRRQHNRYPSDLKELIQSCQYPDLLQEMLEGEIFKYSISEDGSRAFLEGKDVNSF
jgi:hypothetical protein